jgi:type II secretory ATPase GspE/PulE/Tfp pilus assembly ATPase PilB-like protein/FixJ family two-component response regulator
MSRDKSPAGFTPADQRLLGFLARAGKLERAAAEAARAACAASGRSAFEFIAAETALSEADVARALAEGLGFPLVDLKQVQADEWVADLVDESICERYALIASAADDETVTLVMANPFDQEAIKFVEFATGRRVRRAIGVRSAILREVARAHGHASTLASVIADVPENRSLEVVGSSSGAGPLEVDPDKLAQEAEQAPIIKMVNLILVDALGSRSSDIHIEPGTNGVAVRYRIDGMLVDAHALPKWVQNPLTARIKIMAKADITERRTPQDGSFTIRHADRLIDVRVSVLPTTDGEKFVLRLLDPNALPRQLDQLGFSADDLTRIRRLLRRPEGIILVTGPTGSGKTSTLCAMIQEIYSPQRNIVTIENPVEYKLPGVNQVDIKEKQGLTFATVLRSVLRQDPDVIMVGEIRDRETADIAFRAAQTGHLVLSTVHTNDTASTITRLVDIGIEPYLVSSSLVAVIAQRLVRKICGACRGEAAGSAKPAFGDDEVCATCHGTGFSGRTGCYEVLEVTSAIQRAIETRAAEAQLRAIAEDQGMISLRQNALSKVQSGVTANDEAARVIQFETRGLQCPQCLNAVDEHFLSCPFCRHVLRTTCTGCAKALKKEWTSCPYCGVSVNGAASGATANTPAAATSAAPGDPPTTAAVERPRILVVDDDPDVRMLVRRALLGSGDPMDVFEAKDGEQALAMVEKERFHLVILDVNMPGIDGLEVCKRLRADLKTAFIPILMLTALSDNQHKSLGYLAGTDDYLVKPFDSAELRARVGWLLARSYRMGSAHPEIASGHTVAAAVTSS